MSDERTLDVQEETTEETETETEEVETDVDEGDEDEGESKGEAEEETVESLKEKLQKKDVEIENYKKGILIAKQKSEKKLPVENPKKDDLDSRVQTILYKNVEKEAISSITDPDSNFYIEECVDEKDWKQIVGYLPRNMDKSSVKGIHRAMRAAVAAWQHDSGRKPSEKKERSKESELSETGGSVGGEMKGAKAKVRTFLKTSTGVKDWYKQ